MPICRVCRKEIDKKRQQESVDWIMPTRNFYYHVKCYDDWVVKGKAKDVTVEGDDDFWKDRLFDYLSKDIKLPGADWSKITSQWKNLLKTKHTAKGVYFAALYMYDIKNMSREKSEGGIGLIFSIYDDAKKYWIEKEEEKQGTLAAIEKQARIAAKQKTVVLRREEQKKKVERQFSLSKIGEMEDDET